MIPEHVAGVVLAVVIIHLRRRRAPVPQHTSILTEDMHCKEILNSNNKKIFIDEARMDRGTFLKLLT
jgi:hypothetical protein